MRYLNTTTLKQTTEYLDSTTVIDTDDRVKNWFSKCPEGYKGEWVDGTYTFVEIPSLNTDGTVNQQGYGLELLTRDENEELYTYYDVVTLEPDLVKIQEETDTEAQATINTEAQAYLASTDYMVIRAYEGGVAVTEEVALLRQEARDKIS